MSGKPSINTEAVRRNAASNVRWAASSNASVPDGMLVSDTIPALCDEIDRLRQECRDRECTEQDVRARLADAENALARVRAEVQAIMGVSDDLRDRATCESIWLDLCAALDGTS